MKNLILYDGDIRDHLRPLTFTRPLADLRVGILTIREKWERWLGLEASYITQDYLTDKYPIRIEADNVVINGAALPSEQLCKLIQQLDRNEALLDEGELIAARLDHHQFDRLMGDEDIDLLHGTDIDGTVYNKIRRLPDLFRLNDAELKLDFQLLTKGRKSAPISNSNRIVGDANQIFLEPGAKIECSVLNTEAGPIYLGKNAEVMEGCLIRGSLAMNEHAVLKMGTKIYGATTLGPWCKVGGEVNNAIFQAYSNKAHDGFLGNAYIGEWCNLGADSNNSNLKNNYDEVKLWNYGSERFERTGTQFCGLIMGDHSKCGINTMLNTGTVIGVSANVFGDGFPRNFIPSFAWGGASGFSTFKTDKAFEMAERMMQRRGVDFTHDDRLIMLRVHEETAKYRRWE
jgi:UDP-N-acetylglucosamine diphosphorylase/glucosamine-1-phosphate N-acetyltransferase